METNREKILFLIARGLMTTEEIAHTLGVGTHYVSRMAKKQGPKGGKETTKMLDRLVLELGGEKQSLTKNGQNETLKED